MYIKLYYHYYTQWMSVYSYVQNRICMHISHVPQTGMSSVYGALQYTGCLVRCIYYLCQHFYLRY